jgi:hypothetical protein
MAQMPADHQTKLGFRFESDEAASFLVLNCDAKVLEYQALMLEHNRMRHVLPVDVVIKEGISCYYYNITSKISLSFFLARQKLSREEFLKLLLNITSVVNDSAGYLLTVSNFIFDPDYIYISPETLEPMLVYIPAAVEGGCGTTLQTFISDLLLQHINVGGFDGGNLVQRILAEVKSELFNVKSLIIVINDLLYANASYICDMASGIDIAEERIQQYTPDKAIGVLDFKVSGFTILAIFAQVVMGAAIFAARHFLNNISDNPTATYAAVVMIVLALDMLLFKKLKAAKLIHIGTKQESPTSAVQANHDRMGGAAETGKGSEPLRNSRQTSAKQVLARVEAVVNTDRDAIRAASEVEPEKAASVTGVFTSASRLVASVSRPVASAAIVPAPGAVTSASGPVTFAPEAIVSASGVVASGSRPAVSASGPAASASGKTELLARHTKGVRMLKSTRRQSGDEDIFLNKDDFIIGRLADHVDFVLENTAVGKLHAQVLFRNGACYIKDLNSVNGTFINGNRIDSNKEYELKENDRVLLANIEFVYIGG